MGLEISTGDGGKEQMMQKGFTLEERLYKTEDGDVVREGDERAATVYRGPGQKISFEEAEALGLSTSADDGSHEGEEDEDLGKLKRAELDSIAAGLGIEDPDKLGSKAEVITAIEAAREALAAAGEGDD
jgi:hypothetical protein